MATQGTKAKATGLALTTISVAVGVSASGIALLLSFVGVLAGAGLICVGVRMVADDPTAPIGHPRVLAAGVHVRAVMRCLRRNLALAGLLLASVAASATVAATADRETTASPVLWLCAFVLLLLGLSLLNVGIVLLGEQEQEQ